MVLALRLALMIVIRDFVVCAGSTRFRQCGKSQGVVSSSKSSALASRVALNCGRTFIVDNPLTPTKLYEMLDIFCVGTHMCYKYHEDKKRRKSTSTLPLRRGPASASPPLRSGPGRRFRLRWRLCRRTARKAAARPMALPSMCQAFSV
uniref:Secreted protein n=1 Tax=Ixodes ricinus TaxID=34613 RepID=A0A6B0UUR6_IXORI